MEDAGTAQDAPSGGAPAGDGLGESTAEEFGGAPAGAARGRGRRGAASEEVREPDMAQ